MGEWKAQNPGPGAKPEAPWALISTLAASNWVYIPLMLKRLHGPSSKCHNSTFPTSRHLDPPYLSRTILGLLLNKPLSESGKLWALFLQVEEQHLLFPLPEIFFPSLARQSAQVWPPPGVNPRQVSSACSAPGPRPSLYLHSSDDAMMSSYCVLRAVVIADPGS